VTIEFQDQSASKIAQVIGAVTGHDIEIDPALDGNVTLQVRDMPWREALRLLAERVGGQVVELEGGRWRIQPLPR
jgi:type II secretory pathway component GspD/PulD (secretin)